MVSFAKVTGVPVMVVWEMETGPAVTVLPVKEIESAPRLMLVVALSLFCVIETVVADNAPEALATIESAPKEIEPLAVKLFWLTLID